MPAQITKIQVSEPDLGNYQKAIIDSPARFTITEASTKLGKTFSHIWWLFKQAHDESLNGTLTHHWWIAPVYSQAEIAYYRMKEYVRHLDKLYKCSDGNLTITTPYRSIIHFKSAEKPDNLFGEDVYNCVIDEASRVREEAWTAIYSTLTATRGRCKMIGNVKGVNNWFYRLARKAEEGQLADWESFKFTADDAIREGIIRAEEVEAARATLTIGTFLELYYAIPDQNASNKFAFAFSKEKHIGDSEKIKVQGKFPLYISFDFNRNPISCCVFQHHEKKIRGIESIKLPNSNIYSLCETIKNKYGQYYIVVTGDATGKAKSALVKDNLNYYIVIRQMLELSDNQIKVPSVNPSIEENQVLVNSILEHYDLKIHPTKAEGLISDLQFVEMNADGSIKKGDRNDPNQQADLLDCFRYYLNSFHKEFLKEHYGK